MIQISDIQYVSANVKARSKNCWIRRLSLNEFRVVPKSRSKSKRTVVFTSSGILCVDLSGEICRANYFKVPCYHVFCAVKHIERLLRKQARKQTV